MYDLVLVQSLVQRALNLFETSAEWDRKAAMKAHMCGLQGEKRRLRDLSREARNVVDSLQHCTYDKIKVDDPKRPGKKIGLELYPITGTSDVSTLVCPESTLVGILVKLWKVHDEAHQIANDLVIAKMRSLSKPIYCFIDCLSECIDELQRAYDEYEWAKWEYHHISRYQVSHYNVHDEYEKKEEAQGYKDFK